MDYQTTISKNHPLPEGLTTTGDLYLEGYNHPLPEGVMVCWVTQQITTPTRI